MNAWCKKNGTKNNIRITGGTRKTFRIKQTKFNVNNFCLPRQKHEADCNAPLWAQNPMRKTTVASQSNLPAPIHFVCQQFFLNWMSSDQSDMSANKFGHSILQFILYTCTYFTYWFIWYYISWFSLFFALKWWCFNPLISYNGQWQ